MWKALSSTYLKYDVVEEENLVESAAGCLEVVERLKGEVSQLGQIWYTSQFFLAPRCIDPARRCWWFLYLIDMCSFVQDDCFGNTKLIQDKTKLPQGTLRVIPATTLVYRYMDMVKANFADQVNYSRVPMTSDDGLVVPVSACDENPLLSE